MDSRWKRILWSETVFWADYNHLVPSGYGAIGLIVIVTAANAEATTMEKDEQGEIASSGNLGGRIHTGSDLAAIAHRYFNIVLGNKCF